MTYIKVREALAGFGLRGATLEQIIENTNLEIPEIMHHIRTGYKNGGTEGYEIDGTMHYRIRPTAKQKYKRRV